MSAVTHPDPDTAADIATTTSRHIVPRIVFACNSNTCRSQMAEGWANEWIRMRCSSRRRPSSPLLRNHRLVASAALSESSVFEATAAPCDNASSQNVPCYGESKGANPIASRRKSVKARAVEAMASHGIDISHHVPQKFDEVAPPPDPVEKLIILCSCIGADKEEMRRNLACRSKSIEEWNIEAPTAAERDGEGPEAFRRVSLEIKQGVYELMQKMFGEEFQEQIDEGTASCI